MFLSWQVSVPSDYRWRQTDIIPEIPSPVRRWYNGLREGNTCHNIPLWHLHVNPARKSHVAIFAKSGVRRGDLVAVTGITWQLILGMYMAVTGSDLRGDIPISPRRLRLCRHRNCHVDPVTTHEIAIGVRDQFRLGGGGGGWGQLPEYFIHCLPENQVVLPEYYTIFFFCPKMAIWKILGGGGYSPPPPRLVASLPFCENDITWLLWYGFMSAMKVS